MKTYTLIKQINNLTINAMNIVISCIFFLCGMYGNLNFKNKAVTNNMVVTAFLYCYWR
jgi:hypothetical protein